MGDFDTGRYGRRHIVDIEVMMIRKQLSRLAIVAAFSFLFLAHKLDKEEMAHWVTMYFKEMINAGTAENTND